MVVCVAGPLDTGQFLTYLYILLLPVIVLNLIYLAYPTKIVAKVITKSAPWRLQGTPCTIFRTRVKRYKIPEQNFKPKAKSPVEQPYGLTSSLRSSPPSKLVVEWRPFSDSTPVHLTPTWPSKASWHSNQRPRRSDSIPTHILLATATHSDAWPTTPISSKT